MPSSYKNLNLQFALLNLSQKQNGKHHSLSTNSRSHTDEPPQLSLISLHMQLHIYSRLKSTGDIFLTIFVSSLSDTHI